MKEGEKIFIEKIYEIVGRKNVNKLKKEEIRKLEMMGIDIGGVSLKKLVAVLMVGLIIGLAGGIWMGECIKPMPDAIVTLSNSVFSFLKPVANFSYTQESPYANETILFNASQSYDPNGKIEEYRWDFGDGKNESVKIVEVNHTYSEAKSYTVKLTVRDNDGAIASGSKEIIIQEPVPTPEPTPTPELTPVVNFSYSPESPHVNERIVFNASQSYDPDREMEIL